MTNEVKTRQLQTLADEIGKANSFVAAAEDECRHSVFGSEETARKMLLSLIAGGHVLLEGMPGLAKTRLANSIARTVDASFRRIQFTPDLMPSDLIGSVVYNQHTGQFSTRMGPVFANIVLADEINRSPAKVQSALLEAMQERQVTIGTQTHKLPELYFVVATSNPIDQDGTFNLPLAQTDRFAIKLIVDYPSHSDEMRIIDEIGSATEYSVSAVAHVNDVLRARELANAIYIDEKVSDYIVSIVRATREPARFGLEYLEKYLEYGASPRATVWLAALARSRAFARTRPYVTPDDVRYFATDVIAHRIGMNYAADSDSISARSVVEDIMRRVQQP